MSLKPYPLITRLQVKNYRSLADIDIKFEPLTVLVGLNGSGKSNLVDVLRFVRDALTRGLDSAILDRNGINSLRRWSSKGDMTIRLFMKDAEWKGEYGFTIGSKQRSEYQVKWEKIVIEQKPTYNLPSQKSIIEIKNGDLVHISEDIKQGSEVVKSSLSEGSLALFSSIFRPFLKMYIFLRNMGFYSIYPDVIRKPQLPAPPNPLDENGGNLASMLRDLKKSNGYELQGMIDALSKVVSGISEYSVQQVGGYLVTKLHHLPASGKNRSPAFHLAQESDGTLRVLGLLTALYQVPHRSLLTIEEPELTIHPGALSVLCDVLQEASLRSQILVTTHSPELISRFPVEAFRVTEKIDGITHVGEIKDSQRKAIQEKLFSPGELMVMEGLQRETKPIEKE